MKTITLLIFTLAFTAVCSGQNKTRPRKVTPRDMQQINKEIDAQVLALKKKFRENRFSNKYYIKFVTDTLRIEQTILKQIDINYSTAGMIHAMNHGKASYDSLMNHYYHKILRLLNPEDRKTLTSAQKAWLHYQAAEEKLINMMGKVIYAGTGTMADETAAARSFYLVKQRANQLFHIFNEAALTRTHAP